MTILAAGASASISLPAGQFIQVTGGDGVAQVLNMPGASPIALDGDTKIGPFAEARTVSISATRAIDYTVTDGVTVGLSASAAAAVQSLVSGDLKQAYRSGAALGTVIATGGDGIGNAGGWSVTNGTLSTVTDPARPGRTILRVTGTAGASGGNAVVRRKITSTALTGKIEATVKFPRVSAGTAAFWLGFSSTAPAADPPTSAPSGNRQMYCSSFELAAGMWTTVSAHPAVNRFSTAQNNGRAWSSVETLPSVVQYVELQIQWDASVPDAERVLDIDEVIINGYVKPLVVIGFDGAGFYASTATFALPLFRAAGVPGYASGPPSVMQANAARCNELYAAGWDLIHQAMRTTNNYGTNPANLWSDIHQARAILKANGWDRPNMDKIMTMPSNSRTPTTDAAAASAGVDVVGATGGLFPQSKLPVSGLLGIGRMSLNGTTAAQNNAMLDAAILEGSHLWYFGHDLVTTVTDGTTQMLQSEFAAFLAYAVSKHNAGLCEIVTPTEFRKRVGNYA